MMVLCWIYSVLRSVKTGLSSWDQTSHESDFVVYNPFNIHIYIMVNHSYIPLIYGYYMGFFDGIIIFIYIYMDNITHNDG